MRWQVTNLDIDGSIPAQKRLFSHIDRYVDLTEHERNLRLWPKASALDHVRQAITGSDLDCRQLTFYGTGDLNFVSSLLIENLVQTKPTTVVLFDNHPDWFALPPKYHCGNWVSTTLRLPGVESAILVGQNSDDLKGHNFWFAPWPELGGRLRIFPYKTQHVKVPFGKDLHFDTVAQLGIETLSKRLAEYVKDKNVYIAIDKDVLVQDYAITDWEQGQLTLKELTYLIQTITQCANVIGADVCGERAKNPLTGLFKKIDSGRLFHQYAYPYAHVRATEINERTNLAILDALTGRVTSSSDSLERSAACIT